jgi:hypothetical protein
MKSTFVTILAICFALNIYAQSARDFFSFQGVARDGSGKIVANKNISLKLGIHPLFNPFVFREEHQVMTNEHGVFHVLVGGGQLVSGSYNNIYWGDGYYFLQVEIDITGGTNYTNLGSTQLVSVPYAIHAKQADGWINGETIVQTGNFQFGQPLPDQLPGTRLIWYPKKAAFRAGYISGNTWNNNNIGEYSMALGYNTQASGESSIAVGAWSLAGGEASFAACYGSAANAAYSMVGGFQNQGNGESAFSVGTQNNSKGKGSATLGIKNIAHADASTAIGNSTQASGDGSFSSGQNTFAKAFASATFGAFNNVQDNPVGATITDARDYDRIFQIGNGKKDTELSNALTVLRDGKIGVGNGAILPQYILDIDGRPRIRHNVETAGIFFDNSNNEPTSFVGMKTNDEVGFYINSAWRFWVDKDGNAHTDTGILQTSDRRRKRDFSGLSNSLSNITRLTGYHYFWKDKHQDQSLQTGVIAQEVEQIFPELVKTDESGFKSVNYTGLIPHLIESVKALKMENDELRKSVQKIAALEASLNDLMDKKVNQVNTRKEVR